MSSQSVRFATGIAEASIAPFFMVVGFYAWDHHWNGSPFALNMFKCNVAAIGFIIVVVFTGIINENGQRAAQYDDESSSNKDGSIAVTPTDGIHMLDIFMLMLSSVLGIVMADFCWLEGMRILSARKIILVDCLKPFLAAYVGWAWFNEQLGAAACLGLVLTCFGVVMVELDQVDGHDKCPSSPDTSPSKLIVVEAQQDPTEIDRLFDPNRQPSPTSPLSTTTKPQTSDTMESSYVGQRKNQVNTKTTMYGYVVALLNVILHTAGATLTKMYGVAMNTWMICLIRFGFAGLILGMISSSFSFVDRISTKPHPQEYDANTIPWYRLPKMPTAWWVYVLAGVGACTFVFPALINDAIFKIPLALLLTLESIGPLYSLPVSWMVQKDVPTCKSCAGALLAVGGIALLSLKGMITDVNSPV